MNTTYFDKQGNRIFVSSGISKGAYWMTVRQKKNRIGTHRIKAKALPIRDTEVEAQADLDAYAKTKGWKVG